MRKSALNFYNTFLKMSKKLSRNDKCHCGSGNKYKICCLNKAVQQQEAQRERIIYGDEFCSSDLKNLASTIKDEYSDHEVLDVSRIANNATYKPLQLQHYTKNVVMLLERNDKNNELFETRCPPDINTLILYRGAYVAYNDNIDLVYQMIETRLKNEKWEI